jgi:hypothetical protein
MSEQCVLKTGESLFDPPLTASLTPHHYRVTGRTSSGQYRSTITIRTGRTGRFAVHIHPILLIETSLDAAPTTLPLTALDHEILRRRLTQILTMNIPPPHIRIATRSPPP